MLLLKGSSIIFLVLIISLGFEMGCQKKIAKTSKILYLAHEKDYLYTMNKDGSGGAILFKTDFEPQWPSWSPDGRKILFNTYNKEYSGIYYFNLEENYLKKVIIPRVSDLPCWSSDGNNIAFMSDDEPGIIISSIKGDILKTIAGQGINGAYQSWSPSSDKLVFESGRDGNPEIYTINPLTGKQLNRLTNNELLDEWPSFSKDGLLIAWVRGVEGNKNIWVMNEDGSDSRQVTNGVNIGDAFPSFSPDGSELVFQSTSENESTLINIIKIDGSDFRKVGEGFFPNWSPYLD